MTDQDLRLFPGLSIPIGEVVIRTSRSSGPGGQHANVTASRVQASFEIASSTVLDKQQRARLQARFGDRVTAAAQDTRSQLRNRELAIERLRTRLVQALTEEAPRRPTKPPRAAAERRLLRKRRRGQLKGGRRADHRPDQDN